MIKYLFSKTQTPWQVLTFGMFTALTYSGHMLLALGVLCMMVILGGGGEAWLEDKGEEG